MRVFYVIFIPLFFCCSPAFAQQAHYVIIGAFAKKENADRHAAVAGPSMGVDAQIMFNPDKQLYYVRILETTDKQKAIDETLRLRENPKFTDAWIYHGPNSPAAVSEKEPAPADIGPVTKPEVSEPDAGSERFIFNIYRASDNQSLEGEIDMINTEKGTRNATFTANAPVIVRLPKNKTHQVSFICHVIGYRKMQKDIDYTKPEGEGVRIDSAKNIVIDFDLVRLMKGDIAVMYNVFFFKDAAIMRPESTYEINGLLQMMKEKSTCRIKIHGHTNGNAAGRIITMGEAKNFFSLNGSKNGNGSAVKLSEERATVIRDYLVANGIDASRMEIEAWGGRRNIYDKDGARAQENVRVEIEILEE